MKRALTLLLVLCFFILPVSAVGVINPSTENQPIWCQFYYTRWICNFGEPGVSGGIGPQGIPGINGSAGTGDTNYFNFTGSNLTTISNITNFYNSTISNFTVISNITNFYNGSVTNQTDIDLIQFPFLNGTRILTGIWNFGGYNVSNLLDPVSPQDAATMNYVDTHSGSGGTNLSAVYPIGSVYLNNDSGIDPGVSLGIGDWLYIVSELKGYISPSDGELVEYIYDSAGTSGPIYGGTGSDVIDHNPSTYISLYPLGGGEILWIDYGVGNSHVINNYTLQNRDDTATYAPYNWYFEGTNDNTTSWAMLDDRHLENNPPGVPGQIFIFGFTNGNAYRWYRYRHVDQPYGGVGIAEFNLFYDSSPTGGNPGVNISYWLRTG